MGTQNLVYWETQRRYSVVVPGLGGVVDIAARLLHSVSVTCEGEVWTWGTGRATDHNDEDASAASSYKVTGEGIEEAMVVQVAAGAFRSMALAATGGLYLWGKGGGRGQLGHGGKDNLAVPRVAGGIGAVVGMADGQYHSLVTTEVGRVLSCGSDGRGALGLGAAVYEALTPTVIDGITPSRGRGVKG